MNSNVLWTESDEIVLQQVSSPKRYSNFLPLTAQQQAHGEYRKEFRKSGGILSEELHFSLGK
jgi:hypothetical protein